MPAPETFTDKKLEQKFFAGRGWRHTAMDYLISARDLDTFEKRLAECPMPDWLLDMDRESHLYTVSRIREKLTHDAVAAPGARPPL